MRRRICDGTKRPIMDARNDMKEDGKNLRVGEVFKWKWLGYLSLRVSKRSFYFEAEAICFFIQTFFYFYYVIDIIFL